LGAPDLSGCVQEAAVIGLRLRARGLIANGSIHADALDEGGACEQDTGRS